MMRGRGHDLAGLPGERVDGPCPLRQEVEELETVRTGGRLADARDLSVDRSVQRRRAGLDRHNQIIKSLFE